MRQKLHHVLKKELTSVHLHDIYHIYVNNTDIDTINSFWYFCKTFLQSWFWLCRHYVYETSLGCILISVALTSTCTKTKQYWKTWSRTDADLFKSGFYLWIPNDSFHFKNPQTFYKIHKTHQQHPEDSSHQHVKHEYLHLHFTSVIFASYKIFCKQEQRVRPIEKLSKCLYHLQTHIAPW